MTIIIRSRQFYDHNYKINKNHNIAKFNNIRNDDTVVLQIVFINCASLILTIVVTPIIRMISRTIPPLAPFLRRIPRVSRSCCPMLSARLVGQLLLLLLLPILLLLLDHHHHNVHRSHQAIFRRNQRTVVIPPPVD